jgi:hypothetical protein
MHVKMGTQLTQSAIGAKAKWAEMWCNPHHASFAEYFVAFAVVEGISFSGSFVPSPGLSNVVDCTLWPAHQP